MSVRGEAEAAARAAERGRSLRAARTAALAARRAEGAARPATDYLVCACGPERYGLPLAAAAQVLPARPATPVPGAVPALIGLAALSGRMVGVLGLARALGRPAADPGAEGHLVLLRGGSRPVALAVDRVLGAVRVEDAAVEPVPPGGVGGEMVSGYCPARALPASGPDGGRPDDFVILDLPRLLRRALP